MRNGRVVLVADDGSERRRARRLRAQRRASRRELDDVTCDDPQPRPRFEPPPHGPLWPTWLEHREYLFRRCLVWTKGRRCEAEDLLGELLVRLLRMSPERLATVQSPRAWMACVLRNICIDHARARGRAHDRHEDVEQSLYDSPPCEPEAQLWKEELSELLSSAIDTLPRGLRDPLIQRYMQDMDYGDIARHHQITPATARKRCQLARDRLRNALREREPEASAAV